MPGEMQLVAYVAAALAIALLCFLGNLIRVRKSHGVRKMQARQRDVRTGTVSEIVRGLKDIKSLKIQNFILAFCLAAMIALEFLIKFVR